ncbi:hypothetical protein Prum_073860 [Phytohabitans rumicis]|uniref:Uncharacterized protein n=1 Tax=Phytohabitans rumicis TaxID=1076125 RepID=A0A6V8LBJ8_9ACTN|nr:hypothetical protein Prum_073860 [Phytohabitans rumicis]
MHHLVGQVVAVELRAQGGAVAGDESGPGRLAEDDAAHRVHRDDPGGQVVGANVIGAPAQRAAGAGGAEQEIDRPGAASAISRMVVWCARALSGFEYWSVQNPFGIVAASSRTRAMRAGRYSPVAGSVWVTTSTSAPSARMMAMFWALLRGSTTQMNLMP